MPRALRIVRAAERTDSPVVDTLILSHAQRQVRQGFVFGIKGTCVEFDFAEPPRLRTDDALVLEDGGTVEVVAEAEPLIELRVGDAATLARLAWQLGDRHVPVEVLERRLRLRRDPAIEEFLQGLGFKTTAIEASFEPEDATAPGDHLHHGDHHHHDHHHHHHHHHHDHHQHGHHHHHDHDHGHSHDREHRPAQASAGPHRDHDTTS